MKKINILFSIFVMVPLLSFSQTVQFPATVSIPNSVDFTTNVVKVSNFPAYFDNLHLLPSLHNRKTYDWNYLGMNFQNNVPMVCLDDFRYNHKFDNTLGPNGIGYITVACWLPSNGNYLLLYCILENGMDYYREFLVTTSLSGAYIGHLLVRDGWYGRPYDVNFTQTKINSDLTINLYEVRNLNTSYVSINNLSSFTGQKATSLYSINTNGHFILNSTTLGNQRTFSISELKGQICSISN